MANFPTVVGDFTQGGKFILAVVRNQSGKEKSIIRAVQGFTLPHIEMFRDLEAQTARHKLSVESRGGGCHFCSKADKTIELGDTSSTLGRADHKKVAEMIRLLYPEYTVRVNG